MAAAQLQRRQLVPQFTPFLVSEVLTGKLLFDAVYFPLGNLLLDPVFGQEIIVIFPLAVLPSGHRQQCKAETAAFPLSRIPYDHQVQA